ncbi:MAG: GNAT family N-acetyltransferase [Bacteroidetes bacterium]|nr:GNAT family N-acetyltransferase [Bacteroidota bacterium]
MKIDKSKIKLRKAGISDVQTIIDSRIEFVREVNCGLTEETESRLRRSLGNYLRKSFRNNSFVSWFAEYNDQPVAFSGMVIREQPGNFDLPNGKTGYILNMFTIQDFRNNGLGSLLFQKLIDEARKRKLDRIELHATSDGEPIYRKFGLTEPHDKVLELKLN